MPNYFWLPSFFCGPLIYNCFNFQLIILYITQKLASGDHKVFEQAVHYVVKMLVMSHIYDNVLK